MKTQNIVGYEISCYDSEKNWEEIEIGDVFIVVTSTASNAFGVYQLGYKSSQESWHLLGSKEHFPPPDGQKLTVLTDIYI